MAKRANREGSIYKRRDGRWVAQLSHNGTATYKYARTKSDAAKQLQILREHHQQGELSKSGRMTISEWSARWLDHKRARVKPSTFVRYQHDVRVKINPIIGQIKLLDLSTADVAKLHSTLLSRGKSSNTVRHTHSVLSGMLKDAMRFDMIHRNVASLVELPKLREKTDNILSVDEFNRLISATDSIQDRTLLETAINTGMRSGELLGLRWSDVDLKKNELTVNHTIRHTGGGEYELGEPKTKSSRRTIGFQPQITSQLMLQKFDQRNRALKAGSEWTDADFVFTNDFGRPLSQSQMPRDVLYPALDRAGVKRIRFHDLRHTSFSHMIALQVAVTDVAAIAGHSSVAFTMSRYGHALPGASHRATSKMQGLIRPV
ncbi:tyrosine-type recombinase/integrase [SAR202 cluster bacterium JH702]|uniref:Tyrosine-type recombinase/integrase n=1 Tax=Candidatus Lucifugimonas marina TaxID=3038979 RepID=A0ABD4XPK7_9CHLR|nr:tyrosine-type recombinase/integrase [SAR202 cluster bacterium JH702]